MSEKKSKWGVTATYFGSVLMWELFEEMIEEGLAWGISTLILKSISIAGVVIITQALKIPIKRLVKKITYKEGTDKVNILKKIGGSIKANKKTLLGTVTALGSSVIAVLGGTGIYDVIGQLPELNAYGFNISPILFYLIMFVLVLVGVTGKGFESIKTFKDRVGPIKEIKKVQKEVEQEYKRLIKENEQSQKEQLLKDIIDNKIKAEQVKVVVENVQESN